MAWPDTHEAWDCGNSCAYHQRDPTPSVEALRVQVYVDACVDGRPPCPVCQAIERGIVAALAARQTPSIETALRNAQGRLHTYLQRFPEHDQADFLVWAASQFVDEALILLAACQAPEPAPLPCRQCCHKPEDCKWGGTGPCGVYCGNPNHRPLRPLAPRPEPAPRTGWEPRGCPRPGACSCIQEAEAPRPDVEWHICPACGWEDDPVQRDNPDFPSGANDCSLNEMRKRTGYPNA